jgi:hypothetical protein
VQSWELGIVALLRFGQSFLGELINILADKVESVCLRQGREDFVLLRLKVKNLRLLCPEW